MRKDCPLCDRTGDIVYERVVDHKYGVAGSWTCRWCEQCLIAYFDGPELPSEVAYPPAYSQHGPWKLTPPDARGLRSALRRMVVQAQVPSLDWKQQRRAERLAGAVLTRLSPVRVAANWGLLLIPHGPMKPGRVLDVGCGNGRFIAAMNTLGWETFGVEPDDVSRAYAAEVARVFRSVEELSEPRGSFHLVTMNHVIEHLPAPLPVLTQLRELLSPGGLLGIVTPNWRSVGRRMFGADWYALEPPRHPVLYTASGLARLLRRAGFTVRTVYSTSVREGPVAIRKSWTYRRGRPCPSRLAALIGWLLLPAGPLGFGEELVAWANRTEDAA